MSLSGTPTRGCQPPLNDHNIMSGHCRNSQWRFSTKLITFMSIKGGNPPKHPEMMYFAGNTSQHAIAFRTNH